MTFCGHPECNGRHSRHEPGAPVCPVYVERRRLAKVALRRAAGVSEYGSSEHWRKMGEAHRVEEPSYSATHRHRLPTDRGKASEYLCAHCGNQAREWALDHANPTEHFRVEVGGICDGYRYSVDLNDYIPLCRSCHKRFDGAVANLRMKEEAS